MPNHSSVNNFAKPSWEQVTNKSPIMSLTIFGAAPMSTKAKQWRETEGLPYSLELGIRIFSLKCVSGLNDDE